MAGESYPVRRETCEACCRFSPHGVSQLNPILASHVLGAADLIIARGGVPGCEASRAAQVRDQAIQSLELILPEPDAIADGARQDVTEQNQAEPPQPRVGKKAKVGLIGWNTPTGLGTMNRDLVRQGLVDRWLVVDYHQRKPLPVPTGNCLVKSVPSDPDIDLGPWLAGLDWLIFVEHCYLEHTARQAHDHGVRVALIPMWELTHPQHEWLLFVDLVICPHLWSYRVFRSWKERYGAVWDVVYIPWPIDFPRLPFRQRRRCRRFLFINGTGGCRARLLQNGSGTPRRKGIDLVLDAASLLPSVPFLVYTQVRLHRMCPPNVELRTERLSRAELYREGDVCLQPSLWEGLGLQLLECQAAGMPLVTTDAPPMNEFSPLRVIPVHQTRVASIGDFHPFTANYMRPEDLAAILKDLRCADISDASLAAREYIEREHSWVSAIESFRNLLSL
jgi:glycosyltransferase involved in cell wall biosynthesis